MISNQQELFEALGLQAHDMQESALSDRPWYISLLLGICGWVAGILLLIFVVVVMRMDSASALVISGVILIAAAWGLYKAGKAAVFTTQLALALSIAGQILLVGGVSKDFTLFMWPAFMAFMVQLLLVFIMPNALHRMLSTFFACIALALAVRFALFIEPSAQLVDRAATVIRTSFGYALAGWAVTWLPVAALLYWLIRREAAWMARGWQPIVRPVLTGLVAALAFATLVSHPFESFPWSRHGAPNGFLALWPLFSALAALGAIAAGFALKNRMLMGAAMMGVLLHIVHFYYLLGTGLLAKSFIMLVMGFLMLGLAMLLRRGGDRI